MKVFFFAALSLVFLLSSCSSETALEPNQVVTNFFEAYSNGDGSGIVNCLSEEAMVSVNGYVEQLKETPEESSVYLNSIGICISAEKLADITAGDFVTALLESESYSEQLPDYSNARFGEARIYGDRALVPVTLEGTRKDIELVLENSGWKIAAIEMGIRQQTTQGTD